MTEQNEETRNLLSPSCTGPCRVVLLSPWLLMLGELRSTTLPSKACRVLNSNVASFPRQDIAYLAIFVHVLLLYNLNIRISYVRRQCAFDLSVPHWAANRRIESIQGLLQLLHHLGRF